MNFIQYVWEQVGFDIIQHKTRISLHFNLAKKTLALETFQGNSFILVKNKKNTKQKIVETNLWKK